MTIFIVIVALLLSGCVTLPPECNEPYANTISHCPKHKPRSCVDCIELCNGPKGKPGTQCDMVPRDRIFRLAWTLDEIVVIAPRDVPTEEVVIIDPFSGEIAIEEWMTD